VYLGRLPPPKGAPVEDWEDREQTLFRSTDFGDDIDRPLIKSDGGYTYFAADIAYHKDKIDRGFRSLIDVWGADHGGYVKRMQAAVAAVSGGKATLDFDLAKVIEQSQDNPVFYVQYAHARGCSVLRQARAAFPDFDSSPAAMARADLAVLTDESERAILRLIAQYPRVVDQAAAAREPHRIAFFLHDLAT